MSGVLLDVHKYGRFYSNSIPAHNSMQGKARKKLHSLGILHTVLYVGVDDRDTCIYCAS